MIYTILQSHLNTQTFEETQENWTEVLATLEDYICVGLCDIDCYLTVSDLIYMLSSNYSFGLSLITSKSMVGAFRLLYPTEEQGDTALQQNLNILIQNILSLVNTLNNNRVMNAVNQYYTLLKNFQKIIQII